VSNNRNKQTKRTDVKSVDGFKNNPSVKEIIAAWESFTPKIPLTYVLAYRRAIKQKYS